MTLPSPASVPPIVLPEAPSAMATPTRLGSGFDPSSLTPMSFPSTLLPEVERPLRETPEAPLSR